MRSAGIAAYCWPYTSGIVCAQYVWMSARVASIEASYFVDTWASALLATTPATTPKATIVAITTPTNLFLSSLPFLSIGCKNDGSARVSSRRLSGIAQHVLHVLRGHGRQRRPREVDPVVGA